MMSGPLLLPRPSSQESHWNSDVLPSGGLFPSYGNELIPLLHYLGAGLLKKVGGGGAKKVSVALGNRPLPSDYGLIRVS